ncbi:NAD(P)/FAD-dependent oxidoreductase [Roseivivax sp.]
MNLLYANDTQGRYPASFYAETAPLPEPAPALQGDTKADVCVVGAGYTGLSAALHLAEMGRDVVLVEAHRAGFGASGRNGGQLGSGQRVDQMALEKMLGAGEARAYWELGQEAKALVKDLIARHGIGCELRPGVAEAVSDARGLREAFAHAEHMQARYGYDALEPLAGDDWRAACASPAYRGGVIDHDAAHLHPLKYALGLRAACLKAGVRLHEGTEVTGVSDGAPATVTTRGGKVTAEHVVLAANGYLGGLAPRVAARVMPINNFIVATEPLGARTAEVLPRDMAVADDRFVVNYFRLSPDGRLLFGGGESYGYRFPADIRALVSKPMLEIFPHLADVPLTHAWGGTLAITMKRLPHLARPGKRVLSASGYSGHGVGTATHAGLLMARAIAGEAEGFDTMARLPTPRFPGGSALRAPLLVLAMSWYALRDRLGL